MKPLRNRAFTWTLTITSLLLAVAQVLFAQSGGLVAYCPLNGNANDLSGLMNNGVSMGGVTYSTDRFFVPSASAGFDGLDDSIQIPDSASLHFNNMTFCAWVRLNGTQINWAGIVAKAHKSTAGDVIGAQMNVVANKLACEVFPPGGTQASVYGTRSLADGQWHFVALSVNRDAGNISIYVDGTLDGQTQPGWLPTAPLSNTEPVLIGVERERSWRFRGEIDEVRIYNRALSDAEIVQLYVPNLNSGLVAFYPLNGDANDATGYGNNGIAHGPLSFVDHQPFGSAGQFIPAKTRYIEIGHQNQLVLSTAFTIQFWYKPNSPQHDARILQKHYPVNNNFGNSWDIVHNDDNKVRFYFGFSGSQSEAVCPIPMTIGSWHHIAYTYSASDNVVRAYLNGMLVTNQIPNRAVMPLNTTLSLLLMHDRKDSYDAEGWLDEVRIHNRALSALEIMRLHSQRQAPIIVSDPESQIQSQGATVSFRVIAIGEFPLSYQWYFNGTKLAGQTGSALTLSSVQPSQGGKYFAEVRNTVGSVFSATADLAVLDASIGDATRITYSPLPPKEVGRDSLVLVTHGWQPFSNPTWVDDMVAILREKLLMKPNWQVLPYDWRNDARGLDPIKAANHAEMHGRSAGTDISTQGWAHVHLIAHSAGSSLIEAAAEKIRAISSGTTIHTTFLDPFVANGGRTKFGVHSDWSDCYFSHDNPASIVCNLIRLETLRLSAPLTEGPLMNSYNVEVSALDPCAQSVLSSDLKFEVLSRHDWPHDFYANTVSGTQNGSEGLGFPLSKEGGGWDNQGNYTMGQAPRFLGENRTRTELNPLIANLGSKLAVGALDRATSLTGTVLVFDYGASLVSGSPVWLSVAVTVTNPVNFVSLQAAFTSGNTAEGLLSVYWNTNQIGTIDERLISPGFRDYTFALPGTITNGVYALGFRLDPFTAAISSVTVTNITLGISGVTDPIRLSIVKETNASPTVLLTAPAGFTYLVESSTNLVDWTPLAALVNTNGAVQFVDPNASNFPRHFYRAVLP